MYREFGYTVLNMTHNVFISCWSVWSHIAVTPYRFKVEWVYPAFEGHIRNQRWKYVYNRIISCLSFSKFSDPLMRCVILKVVREVLFKRGNSIECKISTLHLSSKFAVMTHSLRRRCFIYFAFFVTRFSALHSQPFLLNDKRESILVLNLMTYFQQTFFFLFLILKKIEIRNCSTNGAD